MLLPSRQPPTSTPAPAQLPSRPCSFHHHAATSAAVLQVPNLRDLRRRVAAVADELLRLPSERKPAPAPAAARAVLLGELRCPVVDLLLLSVECELLVE